jgi:hypothetical protein
MAENAMKKILFGICLGLSALCSACATPRERKARAMRAAQAKLGHFPKSDFVRKYGNPTQCRITWTGETCEFYKQRGFSGRPSQEDDTIWIDFDHDGFSMRDLSAAGY